MRIGHAARALQACIKSGLVVLLVGAPGVGKTDVVKQAVAALDADLIISHPAVEDPTDAKGLPWVGKGNKEAVFLPFGQLAKALSATKLTVWFLDDLGQASPAVQAAYMQLLLAREVNGHKLPDCVVFVAATNRRSDKAGVQGILEPVKSRFNSIVHVEANVDDWTTWAYGSGIKSELIAFIRFRPDLMHDFKPTNEMLNTPSPRTWSSVSKLMDADLPQEVEFEMFKGAVGEQAATEFKAFLDIYRQLPSLDAILLDPDKGRIPDSASALFAVAVGLAHRATAGNFGRIARYCERLSKAGKGEFAVLAIRDAQRRNPEVTSSPDFGRVMAGPIGELVNA